jgi:amidase
MARTVQDTALMLGAISGPDPRSPISLPEPGSIFSQPLERDFGRVRVAWSRDLGGLPVDAAVTEVLEEQRHVFEDLGCVVEDAEPDFRDTDEVFKVLRAGRFELAYGGLLDAHRDKMKDTVVWNIEEGKKLDGPRIGRAKRKRTELYHRIQNFMQRYEFLILPVSQTLTAEDRAALLEVIELTLHDTASLSALSLLDGTESNWPVNASFTGAAIA